MGLGIDLLARANCAAVSGPGTHLHLPGQEAQLGKWSACGDRPNNKASVAATAPHNSHPFGFASVFRDWRVLCSDFGDGMINSPDAGKSELARWP